MNEEGASPGNGAPAAAPAAPAQPTAPQPAAPDLNGLVGQIASLVDEKLSSAKNAWFADLRRAGVFKEAKSDTPAPAPQAAPSPAPTPAPAAPTVDPVAVLALRDAFDDATSDIKLTKGQRQLLRDHVMQRRPDVSAVDSLVADFVKRAGWTATESVQSAAADTPPATQATQAQATPAKPNISDRGTAAPADLRDFEGVLNSRPLEMTGHDVDALILRDGFDQGLDKFQAHVLSALRRVKIKPR